MSWRWLGCAALLWYAIEVMDQADGFPKADADGWRGAQTELHCKLDGAASCVEWVGKNARRGGLSPELTDVLNTLLATAATDPTAAEALTQAREEGLIDLQGKVIARAAEQIDALVPVRRVTPEYPRAAAMSRTSGYVKLRPGVSPDGTVKEAAVLDASPKGVFETAALQAARRWTFKPKLVDGKPVEAIAVQPLLFRMGQ